MTSKRAERYVVKDAVAQDQAAVQSTDRGFTLVEMLVALIVLSVVMLGLLAGFVTSAKSLRSQEARSKAVRVALDRNDSFRAMPYATVPVGTQPVATVNVGGRSYSAATTISEVSAATLGTPGSTGLVKRVATTVSYLVGAATKQVSFTTVVAPDGGNAGIPTPSAAPSTSASSTASPVATAAASPLPSASPSGTVKSIVSVQLSPQPYVVTVPGGVGVNDLAVSAVLSGYSSTALVIMRWTNDSGSSQQIVLSSPDGQNWSATIAKSNVVHATPAGATSSLNFMLDAGGGVTKVTTLTTQGQVANPPSFTAATINPASIILSHNGANDGQNNADVTLRVQVSGLNVSAAGDSVKVAYLGKAGASKEIALVREADGTHWSYTFHQKTEWFTPGSSQPFAFTVRRVSDGATGTTTLRVVVS